MTLPFRRRHNDAESAHDRARAFMSDGFVGGLSDGEATWLDDHLARCAECRAERDAYLADRALLRGLRDRMPEPPRDLWARTAAAIDAEARPHRGRRGVGQILPSPGPRGPRRLPLGVIAGALVVFVVVGTALLPRGGGGPIPGPTSPGSSAVAIATPGATPFLPDANRVAWVQRAADGSFALVFADVDHACPATDPTCAPLADSSPAPLALAAPPQAVVFSPSKTQIAVVGSAAERAGSVLIVDVPGPRPTASPQASGTETRSPGSPAPTSSVPISPAGSASPRPGPSQRAIISGVTVVGSVGFSGDGQWLAFSARPTDGSGGPNLYLWHPGDAQARQVTTDGETYFSGWFGDLVLASGIVAERPSPSGSLEPGASPEPIQEATPAPTPSAVGSPGASPASSPATSPATSPSIGALEAHPFSFLLDPTTGDRSNLALPDVWLPSIDPTGRFVTYWAGTVTPADAAAGPSSVGDVTAWRPATGHLVLDGWTAGLTEPASPSASPTAAASGEPSAQAGHGQSSSEPRSTEAPSPSPPVGTDRPSGTPSSPTPGPGVGPSGTPIELASGPIAEFDAHFDPSGRRLAIWVLDAPEASAGRLWLVVLDPVAGSIDPELQPMAAPGVQALRGYTIDTGRLAWATPAGQDGQPSSVQVLAWKGDDFGQVQSVPGGNPQLVR